MSNFALRIPEDLKAEASALATSSGQSLNQFINNALTSKVAVQKEAERYFAHRAARSDGKGRKILDRAGKGNKPRSDDV